MCMQTLKLETHWAVQTIYQVTVESTSELEKRSGKITQMHQKDRLSKYKRVIHRQKTERKEDQYTFSESSRKQEQSFIWRYINCFLYSS